MSPAARQLRRRLPGIAWSALITTIALFLLAPIIVVVIGSFSDRAYLVFPPTGFSLRWYAQFFASREFVTSALISLKLATAAMTLSTLIGIMAALAMARQRGYHAEWLQALFAAPLMVPGIVTGIAMLFYFSQVGLANTLTSLVLAHVVLTLPFVVRIVLAGLQALDRSVEEAARSLGAGRLVTTLTITLPLIKANVFAAAVFAFIISLDEVVVTLFLASPRLTTLPVRIYNYIEYTSDPSIAAISTILIAGTVGVVLLVDRTVGFARVF